MPIVSSSAARASGAVAAAQKPLQPSWNAVEASAASGSSTISDSHSSATPPPRGPAARRQGTARRTGRAGRAAASATRAHAELLLDVADHRVVGVEELLVDRIPTAEVVDREELLRRGEPLLVHEAREHGPVALGGEDLLRRRRRQEREELLGDRRV